MLGHTGGYREEKLLSLPAQTCVISFVHPCWRGELQVESGTQTSGSKNLFGYQPREAEAVSLYRSMTKVRLERSAGTRRFNLDSRKPVQVHRSQLQPTVGPGI